MIQIVTLPYPQRRDELKAFVKKHHYTRRCTGVWYVAYAILNPQGKIQACAIYGPPPYPSVARAFVRCPEHNPKLIWQTRMCGAGISSAQLDQLIAFANADLLKRGFWWVLTLTDPTSRTIDSALVKLLNKGYTGEVYHRTGALYLGIAGGKTLEGFLIDGNPVHIRQGATTLTLSNVRQHYPAAQNIRPLHGGAKQRWCYVLAETERQRAERVLLMKYHVQPWEAITQPRLLAHLAGLNLLVQP